MKTKTLEERPRLSSLNFILVLSFPPFLLVAYPLYVTLVTVEHKVYGMLLRKKLLTYQKSNNI